MKLFLVCLSFIPFTLFSQIKIDDIGDGWKSKVEQALEIIKQTDQERYTLILQYCTHISYSLAPFSTTESENTILISQRDIINGNLNNIAAILVHESYHLWFLNSGIFISPNREEVSCYLYELGFLYQIPCVEPWLIEHAQKQIKFYSNR